MEESSTSEMIIRNAVVAGHFYPGTVDKLREQIQQFVPASEVYPETVLGVITPHSGYDWCGKVLVETYRKVETPDDYIILGPKHAQKTGQASIFPRGIWNTPLGQLEVNQKLVQDIKASMKNVSEDPQPHEQEHSIEVQLPVIQYFAKKNFKFVPILLPTRVNISLCEELSKAIIRSIHSFDRKVVIVATTDLSQDLSQEMANRKDQKVINDIAHLEMEELTRGIRRFGLSYCGMNGVMTMLFAAKELGASNAELVKYMTSGDTTGDYSQVNGYAGMLIK